MSPEKISNAIIYDLLKEMEQGIREVKQDVRDLGTRVIRIEDRLLKVEERVHQIEDKIDGIRISWSTRLVAGILGTSAVTASAVALVISLNF